MKPKAGVAWVWVVLAMAAGGVVAQETGTVHLVGLQLVGPGAGRNGTELRAFRSESGITLALLAEAPADRVFVEIDDDGCELVRFADDTGRTLMDGVDWGSFPQISEDGRHALIEVRSKVRPAPAATRLSVEGVVTARVAKGTEVAAVDPLEMREGFELEVRGQTLRIVKVEEQDGLAVVLQTSRSLSDDLKEVRFFGAEGEVIEVWGRSSMTLGNATQLEFDLAGSEQPRRLELELWQDLETVRLAFVVASGIGVAD